MPKLLPTLTTLALGAGSIYLSQTYPIFFPSRSSPLHSNNITTTLDVPEHLLSSKTLSVVNPTKFAELRDTRRTTVRIPRGISDEEILAKYTKGMFGGWIFWPERVFLKTMGWELVRYSRLEGIPESTQIWSAGKLSDKYLPPFQATLFGGFRIIDSAILRSSTGSLSSVESSSIATTHPEPKKDSSASTTQSYVDYAFGSETGMVAGVHRFSVFRDAQDLSRVNDEENVTIEFTCAAHSPKANGFFQSKLVSVFHIWYAEVLFREGVAEVMKR